MTWKEVEKETPPNDGRQILTKFWYPFLGGKWMYFVDIACGIHTGAHGQHAPITHWKEIPEDDPRNFKERVPKT